MGAPLIEGEFGPTPETLEELVPIQIPLKRDDVPMSELEIRDNGRIEVSYGTEVYILLALFQSVSSQTRMG